MSRGTSAATMRCAVDFVVPRARVGDSRVDRMRDGVLAQLTVDHSLLAQLMASGAHVDPDTS